MTLPFTEGIQKGLRNKIMHIDDKIVLISGEFLPDVAEEIISNTRAFMRLLATELPKRREAWE
jgi:hypothetical protein